MKRFNHLALTAVMLMLGILVVTGSILASIGTTFFPFDQFVGTRASVAGVCFGAGVMLAGFRPAAHLSWIRLAIAYCVLEVVTEVFDYFWLGGAAFNLIPFVVSIIFGALLAFLYPRQGAPATASASRPAPAAA